MSFITLKAKIKSVLQTITEIQQVVDYPSLDFEGYPAAVVRTNGNTSDYETNKENDEIYSFTIFLFQSLDNQVWTAEKARNIMDELCDIVRDKFDGDEFLSGLSLPSDRVMLGIRPTVSEIFEVSEEAGKYIVAEIELAVRVSKDIT